MVVEEEEFTAFKAHSIMSFDYSLTDVDTDKDVINPSCLGHPSCVCVYMKYIFSESQAYTIPCCDIKHIMIYCEAEEP